MDIATVLHPLPVRILLADDAASFRLVLRPMLETYCDFAVMGAAYDGIRRLDLP